MIIISSIISIKELIRLYTYPEAKFSLLKLNLKQVDFIYKDSRSDVTWLEGTYFPNRLMEYLIFHYSSTRRYLDKIY